MFWFQKGELGYRTYSRNGEQHVVAGTSPVAIILSAMGITLFCALIIAEVRVREYRASPLWCRYGALLIDFWFSLFVYGSVTALVPLLLEKQHAQGRSGPAF